MKTHLERFDLKRYRKYTYKKRRNIMTFYQELQLSSTGSKNLIKTTTDPKERRRHI